MMRRLLVVAAAFLVTQLSLRAGAPAAATLFDDSVVHRIDLLINSRDWESLTVNYLDNTYYPADFKWQDQTVRNIGIRSRGTGSRSGVKPGLRVDFNHYKSSQTLLSLKQVILRNQTQDASNMHERISMLLYQRLGVMAPREAYTTLYINGDYAGLFTIVENPDDQMADRMFGDSDGNMYKYDYNADDQPWYFTYLGDVPGTYVPHPFKPETNETDPHSEAIRDFVRSVGTDSDAAFPLNVKQWISWENFAKHIAVENFVADQDGGTASACERWQSTRRATCTSKRSSPRRTARASATRRTRQTRAAGWSARSSANTRRSNSTSTPTRRSRFRTTSSSRRWKAFARSRAPGPRTSSHR